MTRTYLFISFGHLIGPIWFLNVNWELHELSELNKLVGYKLHDGLPTCKHHFWTNQIDHFFWTNHGKHHNLCKFQTLSNRCAQSLICLYHNFMINIIVSYFQLPITYIRLCGILLHRCQTDLLFSPLKPDLLTLLIIGVHEWWILLPSYFHLKMLDGMLPCLMVGNIASWQHVVSSWPQQGMVCLGLIMRATASLWGPGATSRSLKTLSLTATCSSSPSVVKNISPIFQI